MKIFRKRGNPLFHILDRYIGIPLVFFLSLFKRKKAIPKNCKKIGVLKLAAIGDTVLLAHSLNSLKIKYPDIKIVFFCGETNEEIAAYLPVDKVQRLSVFSPIQAIRMIRREGLSMLIDCESWLRLSAIFAIFSKAKYTVGFKTKGQYKHYAFDCVVSHLFFKHERENFAALFQCFHIGQPISYSFLKKVLPGRDRILIFHPFAGGTHALLKQWPRAYWRKLVVFLEPFHLDIYVTGSIKDRSQIESDFQGLPIKNTAGKLSLIETMGLLQKAQCVVSIDTGIMHIAGALNTPTFCLHGPTDPNRWGAVGENVYFFTKNLSPCIQLGFENLCKACEISMTQILPEEVFEAIKGVLIPRLASKEQRNQ